jgi:hypothetical protein
MKRRPWRVVLPLGEPYLVQLVDQLDRLQLEREVSTPALFVELQLERLQLERAKSRPSEESALLQDDRLHDERV